MGAGVYVGRIGGLAVALGIGAAVFTGHGVASADTSGTSGSIASSTSSKTTSATTDSSDTKTAAADQTLKKKKKSGTSRTAETSQHSTKTTQDFAPHSASTATKAVLPDTTAPTTTANEPTVSDTVAPSSGVTVSAATATADVIVATPRQQPSAPAETVTTVISHVVSALLSPFAGNSPTAPAESPLSWMVMAAARQEVGRTTSLTKPAAQVTTSAVTDPPTNVVAIPQTPLLTALGLQKLPIIGPLFVTPIVTVVNEIPIVSDILHPIFGYPVQTGLAAGSPQPQDVKVISFDGTPINVHFLPAAGLQPGQQAPTILNGPGLGMPGATNLNGTPLDGILSESLGFVGIATLRDDGYNVVTWDPRGEYFSGGQLEIDSPHFEARDVSTIISWVAQQPETQLDGPNDPRLGMIGASYGGGIQLVTAATDHRVDAIVPTIAWNTLNYALDENGAYKSGWGTLLAAALVATFARPNPALYPAAIYGDLTGTLTPAEQALLAASGPGGTPDLVSQITAPTLLFQGTVDTLFPLEQADVNAKDLIANGVPTKVVWFCGGHGLCTNDPFDGRNGTVIVRDTLAWLDRYVKQDAAVSTGPQFEWVDQRGQYYSSNVYPVPTGTPIVTSSSGGHLTLLPFVGGSGPLLGVLPIGGTKAINAINLTIPAATATTYVVGAPQLTFTYSGTGESTHVYAQLVDDNTGMVLGNQVTPIPVTLDGQTRTISEPLEMVAATLKPGQKVTLQLVASAADYETITSLGQLDVSGMTLTLPTADPSAVTVETVAA